MWVLEYIVVYSGTTKIYEVDREWHYERTDDGYCSVREIFMLLSAWKRDISRGEKGEKGKFLGVIIRMRMKQRLLAEKGRGKDTATLLRLYRME